MIDQRENKFKEAKFLADDVTRKYEEVARKQGMLQWDLDRALGKLASSDQGKLFVYCCDISPHHCQFLMT